MKSSRSSKTGIFEMTRQMVMFPAFLVAAVALILGAATPESWAKGEREVIEFDDAGIIIELNATDMDAGFQVSLDGEGWEFVRIFDPTWQNILNVSASGGVKNIGGGTELFLETAEPEFATIEELEEYLALMPEGRYIFFGLTGEEDLLLGAAEFTHVLPAAPVITSPEEGVPVDPENAVIAWEPVTSTYIGSSEISIEGYQVIVEQEELDTELDIKLPATATSIAVPSSFLEPGTEYKFEVLAIEESGNQTITENFFVTGE